MNKCESLIFFRQHRKYIICCFVYLLGLIVGALYIASYPVSSMMRLLVYPQMSIVMGVIVSALPFIVFYIVIQRSAFYWVLPLVFVKAFTFMYCFGGISLAYADAGWLMRFLLLFSDCLSVPLLIWYSAALLLHRRENLKRNLWICLLCVFAIRCIDSYIVSPFAMKLLRF